MDAWPLLLFIVLLFLNLPVMVAIGAGALLYFIGQQGLPIDIFPQRLAAFSQSFPLIAIPMFTFAGVVMNNAGITTRLLNLAETLVGHMSGALAQTNVLLATLMGFESGSGNADAAMQSKMLGTQMVRRGYPRAFAAAIVATSAVITPMMPPGLGFVLYGYLANVSVGRLFMAGIVPGFTMMLALMTVTRFLSKKYGLKPTRARMASPLEILTALRQAAWALTVPFIVIFGLRYGIFTPTEAGGVVAVYSLFVGLFIYQELKFSQLWAVVTEAALATATILMIISAASALGYYMTLEQIADRAGALLSSITTNPLLMLVIMNLLLLLIGMVLESIAALILLTPILVPIAQQVGISPVHLGVLMSLNVSLGAVHPPVGTLMFITCGVLDVKITDYTRAVLPLLAAELGVLALLILFPPLVLTLPNWAFGPGQ
ncbi:TRAP transporter large permease [Acidisoma sp. L85]|jgi:tripartite ATP-independent transporter DctM subunit|uniref:TRAP transporter large permease n=1 Tax=Acidisoma sp. L85 TaxID=1641850 RepID=UPI00131CCA6F|nr:TRAP transporter large permease [Acidisoma sp. L85]